MNYPIHFHDYSNDRKSNYCGFGLKSIKEIKEKEEILKISLDLGLVSNNLVDEPPKSEQTSKEDDNLFSHIMSYTETLSKNIFSH